MRVIGCLSGTSHDAIEVAAADLTLDGDEVTMTPLGGRTVAFDPALREEIAAALPPATTSMAAVCRLDTLLGQAFAEAARRADAELCEGRAELVVSHGQTVYHWVEGGRALGSLQLGQPAWIAELTGLPVVSDLRSRDVARGGQGAPLVSLLDALLLAPAGQPRAALNLGGIANLTVVRPDGTVAAWDVGPANALLDAAVREQSGGAERYDRDGRRALAGRVSAELLADLLADPYYALPPPKSTGKEHFNAAYLRQALARHPQVRGDDVVATLTRLSARIVADACHREGVAELLVSGGGSRNPALMADLAACAEGVTLRPVEALGIPNQAKEALAFALLGFLTVHGVAGTIPACTGARSAAVLGSITPGNRPLRLPDPAPDPASPPRRLRLLPPLRQAVAADAAALASVFVRCFRSAYPGILADEVLAGLDEASIREWLREQVAHPEPGERTVVATRDGKVVAFVRFGPDPDDQRRGHVFSLYTDPGASGAGIGRALLEHAVGELRRAGFGTVTLWVFERNQRARRLYQRAGFRPDGARQVEPEWGAPEIRLALPPDQGPRR
jgi:anhydro-N-acetylmuramic acid kinase